jgi:hypothetical protein
VAFSTGVKVFVDAPQAARIPLAVRVVGSLGQLSVRGGEARVELWAGGERILPTVTGGPSSLDLAVQDIVNCLTHGGQPASTGEDGLAALEIIVGFHVSDRLRGQWVPLPISGADRELEIRIG